MPTDEEFQEFLNLYKQAAKNKFLPTDFHAEGVFETITTATGFFQTQTPTFHADIVSRPTKSSMAP